MDLAFDIQELQSKKIAIYGTGNNARMFLSEYGKKLDVVCIVDPQKTGRIFGRKLICPIEDAVNIADTVVVCASISVEAIIFDRVYCLCKEKCIGLYGINAGDLYKFYGQGFYQKESKEKVLEQIDRHDVISFDLFDTLLARKTYFPADVYSIVETEISKIGIWLDNFYFNRILAEVNLVSAKHFSLDAIYDRIQALYHFDDKTKEKIKKIELQIERNVSVPRGEVVGLLFYALSKGKKVYILTDMYLPKSFLKELLSMHGICGYEDIFVSGELGVAKTNGMFSYFRTIIGNANVIHIGDNFVADGFSARKELFDVCLIPSMKELLSTSVFSHLAVYAGGKSENAILGLFAETAFSNPFFEADILPRDVMQYAELFLAPLVSTFAMWIASECRQKKYEKVLFASRDCFLLLKLYNRLCIRHPKWELPEGKYLYVSRHAVQFACEKGQELRKKNHYIQYLHDLGLDRETNYAFVDFISQGTIQAALEDVFFENLDGLYLSQYVIHGGAGKNISTRSLYRETPITDMGFRESSNRVVEFFMTSMEPPVREITKEGEIIFEKEFRSAEQLEMVQNVHNAIIEYFDRLCELNSEGVFNKELVREIWESRKKLGMESVLKDIKGMKLDDSLNQVFVSFDQQL